MTPGRTPPDRTTSFRGTAALVTSAQSAEAPRGELAEIIRSLKRNGVPAIKRQPRAPGTQSYFESRGPADHSAERASFELGNTASPRPAARRAALSGRGALSITLDTRVITPQSCFARFAARDCLTLVPTVPPSCAGDGGVLRRNNAEKYVRSIFEKELENEY